MDPNEVDTPADVAAGTVIGAKNAAVRKLNHELGIPPDQLPLDKFKFLTRLHYWAADTITHGKERCVDVVVLASMIAIEVFCADLLTRFCFEAHGEKMRSIMYSFFA